MTQKQYEYADFALQELIQSFPPGYGVGEISAVVFAETGIRVQDRIIARMRGGISASKEII